ncbi:hypothetical protein DE146DRAFT_751581 [Phaeosphaeria sp. MPI-PUGE-AT-0046c]|nr:hypothetical protein DE146DRAFT_751581 [Phaeosphaeria sp. MPI-PUGE-AT-0046c]
MAKQSNAAEVPGLLKLPTELHIKIMSYLVPQHLRNSDDGFGYHQEPDQSLSATDCSNINSSGNAEDLARLALAHRQLTPAVQDILYADIALPQSQAARTDPNPPGSRLELLLRTLIDRPGLASRVRSLALWMFTEVGTASNIFNSHSWLHCTQAVLPILERLTTPGMDRIDWLVDLQWPTEAMCGSLIMAILPNLKSIELHAKLYLDRRTADRGDPTFIDDRSPNGRSDVQRLGQGLSTTDVTSLTLSEPLWTLLRLRMPTVKTLTLGCDEPRSIEIPAGRFENVEALLEYTSHAVEGTSADWSLDQQGMKKLFFLLPKLRSLDVPSVEAAKSAIRSGVVEKVIIRNADQDAIACVRDLLGQLLDNSTTKCIELHWSNGLDIRPDRTGLAELEAEKGVKVVLMFMEKA